MLFYDRGAPVSVPVVFHTCTHTAVDADVCLFCRIVTFPFSEMANDDDKNSFHVGSGMQVEAVGKLTRRRSVFFYHSLNSCLSMFVYFATYSRTAHAKTTNKIIDRN